MNEFAKLAKDYLEKPYKRVLTPDEETGSYTAEILEFPGCVAQGDTVEEAYANLEAAAESWIEAALDVGQQIPEPASEGSYSGKVALRMPKSLHRRASQAAGEEGTSLNQFIVAALAEQVGVNGVRSRLVEEVEDRVAFAQECEQRVWV